MVNTKKKIVKKIIEPEIIISVPTPEKYTPTFTPIKIHGAKTYSINYISIRRKIQSVNFFIGLRNLYTQYTIWFNKKFNGVKHD